MNGPQIILLADGSAFAFGGSDEELRALEMEQQEMAIAAMDESQRSLCDGGEHWAMMLVGQGQDPPNVIVMHILSVQQSNARILSCVSDSYVWGTDDEKLDEIGYDIKVTEHMRPRGYPPLEFWDTYSGDEMDPHDIHVSQVIEISQYAFDRFRALHQQFLDCQQDPITDDCIGQWARRFVFNEH